MTNRIPRPAMPSRLPFAFVLLVLLPLAAVIAPGPAAAQGQVRAWGMGGALTAASRGLAAVQYNPANLALEGGTEVGMAEAAVMVGNNSLSLDRYNEITGSYLDTAAKDRLMADIPAGGLALDADVRVSAVGVRSGPVAFTLGGRGQGRGNLDRDYFDLLLYGNSVDQTVDFSSTYGGGYAVASATASFAAALHRSEDGVLAAGVNVRYLQGLYELHIARAGGSLDTRVAGIDGTAYVDALSAEGGSGYAVDLGLSLQRGSWNLAAAVDNVAGGVDWDRGLQEDSYTVTASAVTLLDGNLDTAVTDQHVSGSADPYRTDLPRAVRLGASRATAAMTVGAELVREEGYTPDQPTRTGAAVGMEWRLAGWLAPRAGLRYDEEVGTGGALGLGLGAGPWRIDAAVMTVGGLTPGAARGFGAAVGTKLVF